MSQIAIVSNRIPSFDRTSAGGLAVGLNAALERSGGTWIGWDGAITSEPTEDLRIEQRKAYMLASFSLSERERAGYYLGFANRALWPVLHGRTDLMRFDPSEFATYRAVNDKFAKKLAECAVNHDLVWVHDYHLFFLGQELRRLGVELPLGFFLHVPFPAPDVLAALPCHRALVEALSAYDLVGFQTENDVYNFHEFVTRHLNGAIASDGTVFALGRRLRTGAFPIGIDARRFAKLAAASKEADAHRDLLRGCFRDQLGIIGVDRLDYTKGLQYRLRAFERMLETTPVGPRQAFLLQIAAPSREEVPEYGDLRAELEAISGRINARHARIDWTPVRYINKAFSQTCLAALYRLSRVGLVTPLRDGMNLVAKEYVAAQSAEDPGVLVLSRFAGAAERLTGALLVNPYDIDGVAKALQRAIAMPDDERRERWSEMITEVREHDVHGWRDDFLRALLATRRRRHFEKQSDKATAALFPRSAGSGGDSGFDQGTVQPVARPHPARESRQRQSDSASPRS